MHIHQGKNLFMDLMVIDTINKKAYVFGYDGFLVMKMPDSMYQDALKKAENPKEK